MLMTKTLEDAGLTPTPMVLSSLSMGMLNKIEQSGIVDILSKPLGFDPSGSDGDKNINVVLVWASDFDRMRRFNAPSLRMGGIFFNQHSAIDWIVADSKDNAKRYYRIVVFFEGRLSSAHEITAREPIEREA